MSDDFIEVIPITDEPDVNETLSRALSEDLDYALVIGRKDDGWYFAASEPDVMKALLCTEQFRNYIMSS
jgi:hypothetical protein